MMKKFKKLLNKIILSYRRHNDYIINQGQNNSVEIIATDGTVRKIKRLKGSHITFSGNDNHIKLYEPLGKLKLHIDVSNKVNIVMKGSTKRRYISIITQKPANYDTVNNVYIGENFATTNTLNIELCNGNGNISIGDNCIMSWGILIRVGDWHTIYDIQTKKTLNPNKDVIIGNHVWCGSESSLSKGAVIPDNCVVGAKTLVTKAFKEPNCIIVGIPAHVVKTNIGWDERSPYYSIMQENQTNQ